MTTRTKANLGCGYGVAVFLVLIGVGLLSVAARAFEQGGRAVSVQAVVPAVIGLLVLIGAVAYTRFAQRLVAKQRQEAAWRAQFPQEPWKWRSEWRGEAIAAQGDRGQWVLWFFALVWNAISWAAVAAIIAKPPAEKAAYFVVLFPLIGLGLIAGLIYALIKRRKFGRPRFLPAKMPGVIGGYLGGVIEVPARVVIERDAELMLKCVRVVVTGSGKQRRTSETVLWEQKERIPMEKWETAPGRTDIPVMFYVPQGQPDSSNEDLRNRVEWRLSAQAAGPGVDFSATFEVPVFFTGEVAPVPSADRVVLDAYRAQPVMADEDWRKVGVERLVNGWAFSAQHLSGTKWVFTLIAAVVAGVLVVAVQAGAPVVIWIFSGGFFALFAAIAADFWRGPRRLLMEGGEVKVVRADGVEVFRAKSSDVAEVKITESMKVGEKQYFRVVLVGAAGAGFSGREGKVPFARRKAERRLKQLEMKQGAAGAEQEALRREIAAAPGFEAVAGKFVPGPREAEWLRKEIAAALLAR